MDSGRKPGLAPRQPDSYTSTSPGAWVRRARLAAVLGSPMPTKQTARSCNARAAATVIISSADQLMPVLASLRADMRHKRAPLADSLADARSCRHPQDVVGHPGAERV